MKPSESLHTFRAIAAASGVVIDTATPREGIGLMLFFFESAPVEGCIGRDGDMLLYQWGTYDWGVGNHFELNITRQFVEAALQDDDAISQLSVTFRFDATPALGSLGEGNVWLEGLKSASLFRERIFVDSAFLAVADTNPKSVVLQHFYV